jgi:hypothetical protein
VGGWLDAEPERVAIGAHIDRERLIGVSASGI